MTRNYKFQCVDEFAGTLDEALAVIDRWTAAGEAKSIGLLAKPPTYCPNWSNAASAPTS